MLKSSPFTLPAALPAILLAVLPAGVLRRMLIGCVAVGGALYENVSSKSPSSSEGVSSRWASSSWSGASSGYLPRSVKGFGVRGNSEEECSRR